jgi:hypothetical protein
MYARSLWRSKWIAPLRALLSRPDKEKNHRISIGK